MAVQLPTKLSRRGLLVASGATLAAGSSAALGACGAVEEDEAASPAREAELLNEVLAQQLGVIDAAGAVEGNAPALASATSATLRELRDRSARELEAAISDLDGTATSEPADTAGGESPTEGLARRLEVSIAASIEAIGEIAPERRGAVHRAITEDAAALAALRSVLGEEIAPDAFVMGPPKAREKAAE